MEYDAEVSVSVVEPGGAEPFGFHHTERRGFASTIKAVIAAAAFAQLSADERDETVTWTREKVSLSGYSPVTSEHFDDGLTLSELIEASVRYSDNTATNLVLQRIGGPDVVNEALAALGDDVTNLADEEPALNYISEASAANTTTSLAIAQTLQNIVDSDYLEAEDRTLLLDLMSGNATGDSLIRAGAPAGWEIADKSGGAGAIRNDIAVAYPPQGDPVIITILTTRTDRSKPYDDKLVEDAASAVFDALAN